MRTDSKQDEENKKSSKKISKKAKSSKIVETEVVTLESRYEALGINMSDEVSQYSFLVAPSVTVMRKVVQSGMIYHENKRIEDEQKLKEKRMKEEEATAAKEAAKKKEEEEKEKEE